MQYIQAPGGTVALQATLSSASAQLNQPNFQPHHPITCQTTLRLEEDNSFSCEHVTVPPDDPRTQSCVIHSIAMLIIELAAKL